MEPILPPAQTSFSFNSTLSNCGDGNFSQTVGASVTESYKRKVGWSESLAITTNETVGGSVSVGVSFSANFFGNEASYNASVSSNYSHSRGATSTASNFEEMEETVEEKLFSERTVEVPSGSASLVYDAFQFYPNTKVHFVQRMRIFGTNKTTGVPLSGEEIKSQFHFSGFNGVISKIELNSILITLRGTTLLEKIIKTESRVDKVEPRC